jgi:probable HAF family extracellular repeat protein
MLDGLGGGYARARAVNNSGVVVGESLLPTTGSAEHGVRWWGGVTTDLGTLGGQRSRAFDVNESGIIAGWAQNNAGSTMPVLWNGYTTTTLGTFAGGAGVAWAINSNGIAVGHSYLSSSIYHAAVWNGLIPTDLGGLGGDYSIAYDINATGLVGGGADDPTGRQRACLWNAGLALNLGDLSGGNWNTVRGVNDNGQLILWGNPAGLANNRAVFWDGKFASPVLELGTFGGDESWAYGLNNLGWVVGWAELTAGNYHAFVWDGDSMNDLGTLGGMFSAAYGINDQGTIVGFAQDAYGRTHAVEWVVIPEPDSLWLVGLSLLLWYRRILLPLECRAGKRRNEVMLSYHALHSRAL